MFINRARMSPKRIVFPEGEQPKILRAADVIVEEGIGTPILVGSTEVITDWQKQLGLSLEGCVVVDPKHIPAGDLKIYVEELWQHRQRHGVTRVEARKYLQDPNYLAAMLVRMGQADAMVAGVAQHYPDTIRPALQLLSKRPGVNNVAAMYAIIFKERTIFLADTAVNVDHNEPEDLAEIAILAADTVKRNFSVEPRVAMLSFSNFGSVNHPEAKRVRKATELVKAMRPDIIVDGEMQADTAVDAQLLSTYPFSALQGGPANVLVFPDMTSANICSKLLLTLGGGEGIGPILMGMNKTVHVLQRGCDVGEIVQVAAFAAVDAKESARKVAAKAVKA